MDVALYQASAGILEIEGDGALDREADIQVALERATQRNVELLTLNRAPATVCAAALLSGRPVLLRDGALYTRYLLAVTTVASDFLETESRVPRHPRPQPFTLGDRPKSPAAHPRLHRWIEGPRAVPRHPAELPDRSQPAAQPRPLGRDADQRGDRHRQDRAWCEQRPVPYTYGQILADLESTAHFSDLAGRLKTLAALRAVLAHEYLELRFGRVASFVGAGADAIGRLARLTQAWLQAKDSEGDK